MHNHTLFILHILTYDFLRILMDHQLVVLVLVIFCLFEYIGGQQNIYHQYNQYSYPNIEANIFEASF